MSPFSQITLSNGPRPVSKTVPSSLRDSAIQSSSVRRTTMRKGIGGISSCTTNQGTPFSSFSTRARSRACFFCIQSNALTNLSAFSTPLTFSANTPLNGALPSPYNMRSRKNNCHYISHPPPVPPPPFHSPRPSKNYPSSGPLPAGKYRFSTADLPSATCHPPSAAYTGYYARSPLFLSVPPCENDHTQQA